MSAVLIFPNTRLFLTVFLLLLAISGTLIIQTSRMPKETKMTLFNVLGESIFLQLKQGHTILIDGGLDASVVEKLFSHLPFWEKTIDVVVASHPDSDHIQGLLSVLDRFNVKQVFVSGVNHDSRIFFDLLGKVKKQNIPIVFSDVNTDFRFGNNVFDVVFPQDHLLGKKISQGNNTSLVIRFSNKSSSVLFTGDIEKNAEHDILSSPVKTVSQILKVAHHGSKTSSSEEFLRAVSPQTGVISAHKTNPYGHPHKETLDRLSSFLISILSTKYSGDVSLFLS